VYGCLERFKFIRIVVKNNREIRRFATNIIFSFWSLVRTLIAWSGNQVTEKFRRLKAEDLGLKTSWATFEEGKRIQIAEVHLISKNFTSQSVQMGVRRSA
jgi:hypothetical protein